MPPYGEYQQYPPTMPGGYRPPSNRRTPLIIAFAIAGVALLIAVVAVVVAVLKSNDDNDDAVASRTTTTTIAAPGPTTTQTQIETPTTVVQTPNRTDVRSILANQGYVYDCDSNVLRMSTQTQCGWAQNVRQATISRGSFSGVPIYSPYLGSNVYTTCADRGSYYICQGQTSNTIAVIK